MCGCGRIQSDHSQESVDNGDFSGKGSWSSGADTRQIRTDAYGQMEFVGFNQRLANYVRVSDDTQMDAILEVMLCQWKLEPPNLLISVTGGAKNFTMKPRLKDVFRRGIIKAAQSTGAWITTGGTNAGVMKQVGEAIRDHAMGSSKSKRVVCLGITPWGSTCNKQLLVDPNGKWPAAYDVIDPTRYGEIAIEPNHSHFIFVDDGSSYKFGGEIKFRGKLEAALSNWKLDQRKVDQLKKELGRMVVAVKIPLVIVVLEGGPGTIGTVYEAVCRNGTPAVFVEGSRRAADIFAYAYSKCRVEEEEGKDAKGEVKKIKRVVMEAGLREKVYKLVQENWGDKDVAKLTDQVVACLEKIELLNVFRLDSSESAKDIDVAILQALLKANKEAHIEQLKLALTWNRIDIAKSEIFTEDKKWKTGELDKVMHQAVLSDRAEFVSTFLENGVSLKLFVTRKRLLRLYSQIPQNTILHSLLEKKKEKDKPLRLRDIGEILQDLIGEFYDPVYLLPQYNELLKDDFEKSGKKQADDFPTPSCELFIWAVLLNRREMAELFWKHWEEGKENVAAALTASKILKTLAEKATDYEQQKNILEHAQLYVDRAIGVLNESFTTDEQRAQQLLIRVNKNFGYTTCLQLAVEANNMEFLAHSCCQALLSNIWYGKLAMTNPRLRLLLSLCFPPLIFALIHFREDTENAADNSHANAVATTHQGTQGAGDVEAGAGAAKHHPGTSADDAGDLPPPPPPKKRRNFHIIERMYYFYDAPIITFSYNCFSYAVFLLLFSYIMIQSMNKTNFTGAEIVLCIWILSFIVEEMRQVVADDAKRASVKVARYFSDSWNILDVVVLILFVAGIILRCIPFMDPSNTDVSATESTVVTTSDPNATETSNPFSVAGNVYDQCFLAARIVLSFDLMIFYIRIFHMFSVLRALGPQIVMIGEMIKDFLFFALLLGVIMLAYGVATQAMLFSNVTIDGALVKNILYKVFWQFFGVSRFDDLGEGYCLPDDNSTCASFEGQQVSHFLLAVYTFFTSILLLNLLIALMNFTVNNVASKSDMVWMYHRYFLIYEYHSRPGLAPPLILLHHAYLLIVFLVKKCSRVKESEVGNTGFRLVPKEEEAREAIKIEAMAADEFVRKSQGGGALTEVEGRVLVYERIGQYEEQFTELKDSHTATMEEHARKLGTLSARMNDFEEKLIHMTSALRYVVECMRDPKKTATLPMPDVPDYRAQIEEEKRKQEEAARQMKQIREKLANLHVKARTSPYPGQSVTVERFPVGDEFVDWKVNYPDYRPVKFTAPLVLDGPRWADEDLLSMPVDKRPQIPFNAQDRKKNIDRRSHVGRYEVVDGIPLNPRGRTGMCGRGLLGRWGPNHAGDPVVTRWKLDANGSKMMRNGKPVLEFIAIKRTDNQAFAIPGGMIAPGQEIYDSLKTEFTEEALGTLMDDPKKRDEISTQVNELWKRGKEVYRGYCDDPRNTDNAWIETIVVNYHDEDSTILRLFKIQAGDSADLALWQEISGNSNYHASHGTFIRKVAEQLNAAFD